MKILLTSVGRRSYLVKYFKEAVGVRGEVHVSNSNNLTPAFQLADKCVVSPLIHSDEYIPFLLNYCKQNDIEAIISLFDIDLPILSSNKKQFNEQGVQVIVSDPEVIEICNDKKKTQDFLNNCGLNSTLTYLNLEDVKSALNRGILKFPLIIKPRWGMGSIGVFEAKNALELEVFFNKTMEEIKTSYLKFEIKQEVEEYVLIQEKLSGQEYGLDIINDLDRNYKNTIVKIKHAMRAGETDCAEVVDNPILKMVGKKISENLRHIGNMDVDVFLINERPYILEMNARFGGGYPMSHIAGVNLPRAIISWLRNEDVDENLFEAEVGVLGYKDLNVIKGELKNGD